MDVAHGAHHLVDHLAAAAGQLRGRDRELVGGTGVVGVLAHGGGHLLHRRGGLLQGAGLLFRAAGQVQVAAGDLAGGRGHAVGTLAHLADHVAQLVAHAVQGAQQLAGFVPGIAAHAVRQVAGGHGFHGVHGARQRGGDAARDGHGQGHGDQHGQAPQAGQLHTAAFKLGLHAGGGVADALALVVQQGLQGLQVGVGCRLEVAAQQALGLVGPALGLGLVDGVTGLHEAGAQHADLVEQRLLFGRADQLLQLRLLA